MKLSYEIRVQQVVAKKLPQNPVFLFGAAGTTIPAACKLKCIIKLKNYIFRES